MIMSSLWVCSELLLAFYNITLTHNVLQYTAESIAAQTACKFASFPPQILVQQSTVLGRGLLSIVNEGDRDTITKYGWWENSIETEILIHSFPVLVNSQDFHLFCKCKDKPEGYLKIYSTLDTLMGCECGAVNLCLRIMLFSEQFYFRDLYTIFPEPICGLSQDMSIKVLGKCLMNMNKLFDKNSYPAAGWWLKIERGQWPPEGKWILFVWIPRCSQHRTNIPKQHTLHLLFDSEIVFMISKSYGLMKIRWPSQNCGGTCLSLWCCLEKVQSPHLAMSVEPLVHVE